MTDDAFPAIEPEALARALEANPDYRVLRRFIPDPSRYLPEVAAPTDDAFLKTGVFLDVEATGLDTRKDRVLQLALVPFRYDSNGVIADVGAGVSYFDDPGVPISAEITELTGITDDMVKGQAIDEAAVSELVSQAGIVISHHAGYDRPMIERRIPAFAEAFWGCSWKDIDWKKHFGCRTSKLAVVLSDTLGRFHEAHRAVDDCHAAVYILAAAQSGDGRNALAHLLESARKRTARIWAVDSPFGVKDRLHARGYQWSNGEGGTRKCWFRDVLPSEAPEECRWLAEKGHVPRPDVQIFNAKDRYSVRVQ